MKKSPHSSLQDQIQLTAVMVKEWGPSQSSFTHYRKLADHQRVHQMRVSTLKEQQWTPSAAAAGDTTGTKPSKVIQPEPSGSTLEGSCKI